MNDFSFRASRTLRSSFEWLERAYNTRDAGLTLLKGDMELKNLKRDPRYSAFLKKMKLPID